MVTVLSVDGGGIRGVLPARILDEMRRRLCNANPSLPFSGFFDLIAGSSTGALIALGIALEDGNGNPRYSTTDIIDLYEDRGGEIFPSSYHTAIHTAIQAFRHKYPAAGFERLLRETFGDATLRNASTNLLITSFDTEAMQPHCMKHRPSHPDSHKDFDYLMRDAARASAAAPTYFPPARISPVGRPDVRYSLIDGAVFANNPSGLAYVESTKIFPDETEFLVLSLGTGDLQQGYSFEEIRDWGYMEWVNPMKGFPIGAIMSAGQSEAVTHQLRRISGVRYVRINAPLNGCAAAMDDAGRKNLECLRTLAERTVAANDRTIDDVCALLAEKTGAPAGEKP